MKKLITLLLLCSSMAAFAQKTNFSGTWVINKTKTAFKTTDGTEAPEYVLPRSIKIEQGVDKISISRTKLTEGLKEESPVNDNLAFDGTPIQRPQVSGPVVTLAMHWLNDKSFIINLKGISNTIETWTLEDGGKTLIVNRDVTQNDNGLHYTLKAVYDKK